MNVVVTGASSGIGAAVVEALHGDGARIVACARGEHGLAKVAATAPGVGLGLALSRRLAVQMGGRLALDDAAPGGACFVLTLLLAESPAAAGNG